MLGAGTGKDICRAPAHNMAVALFKQHEQAIFNAVEATLDVDDLATKMAEQIVKKLQENPGGWGSSTSPSTRLKEKIDAAVIDKVAEMKASDVREEMQKARPEKAL